jgi:hypothetical protein
MKSKYLVFKSSAFFESAKWLIFGFFKSAKGLMFHDLASFELAKDSVFFEFAKNSVFLKLSKD